MLELFKAKWLNQIVIENNKNIENIGTMDLSARVVEEIVRREIKGLEKDSGDSYLLQFFYQILLLPPRRKHVQFRYTSLGLRLRAGVVP